jgi:hypothetical protein
MVLGLASNSAVFAQNGSVNIPKLYKNINENGSYYQSSRLSLKETKVWLLISVGLISLGLNLLIDWELLFFYVLKLNSDTFQWGWDNLGKVINRML